MDVAITDTSADDREESVRLITESAAGVLKDDRRRARSLRLTAPGFDAAKWADLADQGWLMLRLPEDRDGLGMGLCELCAIARAMGAELCPEPIPMAALIAPALPDAALASLLSCAEITLPAFAAYDGVAPILSGGTLTGRIEAIPYAGAADAFLVQTGTGGALVRADAPGLVLTRHPTHDGGHLGTLNFAATPAMAITADMDRLRDEATLVLAAQLLGIAETAFDITLTYLKDRRQFGQPIGAFQALQHRTVDLVLELALMRAAVEAAANALDDGAPAARFVSLAKARATRGARAITQAAIQLHGGIGYTDEADIGLYLRKSMTFAGLLGTEQFHRHRALSLSEAKA